MHMGNIPQADITDNAPLNSYSYHTDVCRAQEIKNQLGFSGLSDGRREEIQIEDGQKPIQNKIKTSYQSYHP